MRILYLAVLLLLVLTSASTLGQTRVDSSAVVRSSGTILRGVPPADVVKPKIDHKPSENTSLENTSEPPSAEKTTYTNEPTIINVLSDDPPLHALLPDPPASGKAFATSKKRTDPTSSPSSQSSHGQPEGFGENIDTKLSDAYLNASLAYYQVIERRNLATVKTFDSVSSYYLWALNNRKKIISRQQFTGALIFGLVVLVVLSGLVFSAIQFNIALKSAKKKVPLPDTSFKASLSGVEVSSSVLGVIILTLSIAFFYLYLTKVYPLVSLDQG